MAEKDKMATLQVLGCLIKQPLLLLEERYRLEEDDFPERFHKIMFAAVEHLVKNGVQQLTYINIDDFLTKYPNQYKIFTDNKGLEYIENAIKIADEANFDNYYQTLRKFSLLNKLGERGFRTSEIYDSSLISGEEYEKMQRQFDDYSLDEIIDHYDQNVLELKDVYASTSISTGCQASKGMADLKEQYKEIPEMGMPLCSQKLTTITRGRRLKKLYLKTLPSGYGKTRLAVSDSCCVSIPSIYDWNYKKWKHTGCNESTLFITTELEISEIQSMIIAYVSGVAEDHILDGKYSEGEEEIVDQSIQIIEHSNLHIEFIPNFNIDDIERIIKRYKVQKKIGYVFFDYVFTSIKILTEVATKARGVKLREDNVLVMFVDRMKTLCNELNIHIDTSSQANGDWKNVKDADMNIIRGAKGMADKIDIGYVGLPVTEKDRQAISHIIKNGFTKIPNLVFHVYKVRRGKINNVKLWVYFDYATCRTYDCFITDNDYNLINVENTTIEMIVEQTTEALTDKPFTF